MLDRSISRAMTTLPVVDAWPRDGADARVVGKVVVTGMCGAEITLLVRYFIYLFHICSQSARGISPRRRALQQSATASARPKKALSDTTRLRVWVPVGVPVGGRNARSECPLQKCSRLQRALLSSEQPRTHVSVSGQRRQPVRFKHMPDTQCLLS